MAFSRLIAGTMTWGIWGKNYNTNQMVEMLNACLENNISSFDHADIYGGYTTEAAFGKAFTQSKITRDKIQLISKCGIAHTEGRGYKVKHYNYTQDYIVWSVEQSLQNLQTDYLDLLLLHRPSPLMQTDEIAAAIVKLKQEGKIKYFGLSNFSPLQTQLIAQETKVAYNQIQFSATHLAPMLDGSLDYMQIHKITPMAWNPLGSVFKDQNEQSTRLLGLLKNLESKYNTTSDVLLLAWIMQHPAGVLPVLGTTNVERLNNATQSISIQLELEDWFAVWEQSTGNKVP
jgi:predicted oxidoreductase